MSGDLNLDYSLDREKTMAGITHCWGMVVPHIVVNGQTLTPRIQREKHMGGWRARHVAGLPFAETHPDGRVIYATPGGGSYVA